MQGICHAAAAKRIAGPGNMHVEAMKCGGHGDIVENTQDLKKRQNEIRDEVMSSMKDTAPRKLILFDIDGTLIRVGHSSHGAALEYGVRCSAGKSVDAHSIDLAGRTDSAIVLSLLGLAGYAPEEGREMLPAVFESMIEYYGAHEKDLRPYVFCEALDILRRFSHIEGFFLGLLTGNHEAVAWHKLKMAGIDTFFRDGAFGNEAEVRADLIPVALERINRKWSAGFGTRDVVIIGDTPRDIECGKCHGALTVAVATGGFAAVSLEAYGADLVLENLGDSDLILELLGSDCEASR
jgi:phosphoglycolate phosphatase